MTRSASPYSANKRQPRAFARRAAWVEFDALARGRGRPLFAHSRRPEWQLRMVAIHRSRCSAGASINARSGRRLRLQGSPRNTRLPTHLRRSRSRPATTAITSRASGFPRSASSPSPARPRSPPRPGADIGPAELGATSRRRRARSTACARVSSWVGLPTSFSASCSTRSSRCKTKATPGASGNGRREGAL